MGNEEKASLFNLYCYINTLFTTSAPLKQTIGGMSYRKP